MRARTILGLTALVGIGAVVASGFPKRIGLTASEAAISLPGDLIVPRADVVVDRAVRIDAPIETVWGVLEAAFHDDESGRIVARTPNSSIITRVPVPGLADEGEAPGSSVLALLDLPNGRTLLHMRERYESSSPDAPRAIICVGLALESFETMRMLHDIKRAA